MQRQRHVADSAHAHEAVVARVGYAAEVLARAEGATGAGDDQHAVLTAPGDGLEGLPQLDPHGLVDGVLAFGPVHRHGHDTVGALDTESLHGRNDS